MNVDAFNGVIEQLLKRCWHGFYESRGSGRREFQRDLPRLRMAILRYGKECSDRGWEFDLDHFEKALVALVRDVLHRAESIDFLPVYLENAVRRHVDQRADVLAQKAKIEAGLDHVATGVLRKLRGGVPADGRVAGVLVKGPRPPAATEIAANLFDQLKADLRARRKAGAAKRKPRSADPVPDLFLLSGSPESNQAVPGKSLGTALQHS